MLVFAREKLVFLSVPKTGTTAWQAALEPLATMVVRDPPELKHAPVFRYNRFFRPMLEKFVGEDLTVLAVMREPVDWLGSWFRYRQRDFLKGQRTSTQGLSFDAFVQGYMKGDRPAFANVGSQAKFLEPQRNGTAATHLFRYEDQPGLKAFLEERLGTSLETEVRNASPSMRLDLSPEVAEKFRRKFDYEFALYEGIGANGDYTPLPGDMTRAG
ncbi:sulfotransferase family 2 domain-containing protein [Roseovarius sp.]|uniref:sulfotransferase family 2 domain-containing protein n=1 Tax=Roseovarius sp. TaxID=1486281 RepID=UPI002620F9D7|nr:sulfotransferase family 2 domain-containing protein [Roseovarius sp.]MDM8167802.1 sulfotransferase family 2 domain-containing protein [Roseovarius sp.]